MRFKVGDKVRVRKDLEIGKCYGDAIFTPSMQKLKGKSATITKIEDGDYNLDLDGNWCFWSDRMLEPASFTRANLEVGDIVKLRNGIRCVVMADKNLRFCDSGDYFTRLYCYSDDLKHIGIKNFDIVRVKRPEKYIEVYKEEKEKEKINKSELHKKLNTASEEELQKIKEILEG